MKKTYKMVGLFVVVGLACLVGIILKYAGNQFSTEEDDLVVIGSPIWNDRLSTPILTLLDKYEFNKQTTQFIFYAGGGKAAHAEKQIEKMGFEKKAIVLKQPLSYKEEAKEALKDIK